MMFGGGRSANTKRKCKQKLIQLKITLEDSYNGARKSFEYSKRTTCKKCFGSGSADPNANSKCGSCGGKGIKLVMQRMGHIVLQTQQTCRDCEGEGRVIKEKCKECKGEKVSFVTTKKEIDLDKGVPDGHRYTFVDEGDEYPDIETGDLYVEIFLQKHKDFIRKGADLVYKTDITLLQALTGFKLIITHLDGRKIEVKTKPDEIIKPGKLKTIKELGMPFFNSPYRYGNLYIDFEIIFPERLNEEEARQVSEVRKSFYFVDFGE